MNQSFQLIQAPINLIWQQCINIGFIIIYERIYIITENQSNHFEQNWMQVYCTALGAKDINYQKLQKQLNGSKILNSQVSTKKIKLNSISTLLQQVDEYQRLFSSTQQFIFKVEKILGENDKQQYQVIDGKKLQEYFINFAQQEISEEVTLEILQNKMHDATQQFNKQNSNLVQVQQQILTYEKQNTGSFTTRSANQLLGAQKINSETLANMVLILQKHNFKEFKAIIDDVKDEANPFVPESYTILMEDSQQAAVAVLYLKSQKSTATQLMRDNKFVIKEFDDNYVEENQTYHDSLKKQKEQKLQDLCHFIKSVKGELYKILYEIIVMKTICECQLRFGQQFKLAVIVASDNQMKSVKSTIKDQMSDQQMEDDEQLYDKDFEQDNAFLSVVLNNYQIGDVLK